MNKKKQAPAKLKEVELTQQEWWDAQRSSIHKNRKKYTRKGRRSTDWLDSEEE